MRQKWATAAVIRETADVVTIIFNTGNNSFSYKPGQFINLTQNIDGETLTRSYSLCSCPDDDERPAITVKLVPGGRMSSYILDHATEVQEWEIDGPFGVFHPDNQTLEHRQIVLIAGGSGISPIYGILKYLLKHSPLSITLIVANKTESDIIYRRALNNLEQQYAQRLEIWHAISREESTSDNTSRHVVRQRMSRLILKKILKQSLKEGVNNAAYFICGPAGFISLAEDTLIDLKIPETQIRTEFFSAPATREIFTPPNKQQDVLLHFGVQTNLLDVPGGKTILEAALQDRIPIRYSCRNGTCGTCIGKVLSGTVIMRCNYALGTDQLKEGYTLLCQAYPVDDTVAIEVTEA